MRSTSMLLVALILAAGCSSAPAQRSFPFHGQVISLDPDHQHAIIKHDEIKGFMAAMTMSYKVKESRFLDGIAPGDLIDATLIVVSNDAYLIDVKKVGQAPLEKPAEAPPASSGFELIRPGEAAPNATFLDQDGRKRTFASFKGSIVVVTFIYTQCPLPEFCPLMDRHFVSIQRTITGDAALKNVHLVSVSFDPATDTPPVLKKHAQDLGADLKRWTFLTGERDEVDQFAARFGVAVTRALDDPRNITHNLRTAIVDAGGNLVKVYVGNEWSPADIVADLKRL